MQQIRFVMKNRLLNIYCSQCFSVDLALAVACLGLVASYKNVFQLLFREAAACLFSFAISLQGGPKK